MHSLPAILICSYLLGSIPFGYILVLIFHCRDIRESGSGNIGATNVARSSLVLGFLTLLLDSGKGYAAVALAMFIYRSRGSQPTVDGPGLATHAALAAVMVVCGHMFPVWLKFNGGKGVATGLGSFALLAPKAIALALALFLVTFIIFRFVSLSSMLSVASFPAMVWLLHEYRDTPLVIALISFGSLMIVLKHQENIRRLVAGTEPHFQSRPR